MFDVCCPPRRRKAIHAHYKSLLNAIRRYTSSVSTSTLTYVIVPVLVILVFLILSAFTTLFFVILASNQHGPTTIETATQHHFTNTDIQFMHTSSIKHIVNITGTATTTESKFNTNILFHIILDSDIPALARLVPSITGKPQASLSRLASILGVQAVAPAVLVTLRLPITLSSASRRDTRTIHRLVGHPRPESIHMLAFPHAVPASFISKPAPQPHTWQLAHGTSAECQRQQFKPECARVRDALLVAFIAGCDMIADSNAVFVSNGGSPMGMMLAQGLSCFKDGQSGGEVVSDVWKKYVVATCSISQGGFARIKQVGQSDIGWGVQERAKKAVQWAAEDLHLTSSCRRVDGLDAR